jgi:hypothetical protein
MCATLENYFPAQIVKFLEKRKKLSGKELYVCGESVP